MLPLDSVPNYEEMKQEKIDGIAQSGMAGMDGGTNGLAGACGTFRYVY